MENNEMEKLKLKIKMKIKIEIPHITAYKKISEYILNKKMSNKCTHSHMKQHKKCVFLKLFKFKTRKLINSCKRKATEKIRSSNTILI